MKKNLRIIVITILIICSFKLFSFATDIQDLNEKQEEIQKQKEEADRQLEEVKKNLSETMYSIEELQQKIIKNEEEVTTLNKDITELAKTIELTEQNLQEAEARYQKQKSELEERLIVIYEAGETQYLDVLLKSSDLYDFISNYYLITEIVQRDTEMLEDLEKEKKLVETAKQTLESQKEKIVALRNNAEKNSNLLANMIILKNNYVNQLSEEEKEVQSKIDTYDAEMKQIESEIYALTNLDSEYSGGIMAWPAPGYTTITSPFGYRIHPIFGVQRFHTGLDIGSPLGSSIIAANKGTVVKTAYSSSYGNMIMIDHGGGILTVYAHLAEILVNTGQEVERGTIIAKSGSTGWSTGPHLHFEVRINGEYVDPLTYLKSQN